MRVIYEESTYDPKTSKLELKQYPDLKEQEKLRLLSCTPDIRKLFYKLNLTGWEDNDIESVYLQPLHDKFKKVSKILWKLWFDGENFWKIPMYKNEELVKALNELINVEVIAERLLGNPLKRDQINFLFKVIQQIYKADDKLQNNLKGKD